MTLNDRSDWLALTTEEVIEPDIAICDPHHHFWEYADSRYLLEDLQQDLSGGHNVVGTVFVECQQNYREEGPEGYRGKGIADEKPIAVKSVKVNFVLPEGRSVAKVEALSPESPDPQEIEIEQSGGRVRFTVPEFLVYGLARIHLEASGG